MNNRRAIAFAAGLVIVAGFIVVVTLRRFAPDPTAPAATAAAARVPAAEPTVTDSPSSAPPVVLQEAPPPWALPEAAGALPDAPATAADPVRERQLRELQQSMRSVMAEAVQRSDSTNAHLRQALTTLEQMNDPAVTSQINLPAVRHNLEVSIRMQARAAELQQALAQPVGPHRQQLIDDAMAAMRQLQSQLRSDVRAPGATVAVPAMPAMPGAPAPAVADPTP